MSSGHALPNEGPCPACTCHAMPRGPCHACRPGHAVPAMLARRASMPGHTSPTLRDTLRGMNGTGDRTEPTLSLWISKDGGVANPMLRNTPRVGGAGFIKPRRYHLRLVRPSLRDAARHVRRGTGHNASPRDHRITAWLAGGRRVRLLHYGE